MRKTPLAFLAYYQQAVASDSGSRILKMAFNFISSETNDIVRIPLHCHVRAERQLTLVCFRWG